MIKISPETLKEAAKNVSELMESASPEVKMLLENPNFSIGLCLVLHKEIMHLRSQLQEMNPGQYQSNSNQQNQNQQSEEQNQSKFAPNGNAQSNQRGQGQSQDQQPQQQSSQKPEQRSSERSQGTEKQDAEKKEEVFI